MIASVANQSCSHKGRLRDAWTDFLAEIDQMVPYEWFGHLTHSDETHPEQSNRQFLRWLREINTDRFGHRYRTRGEGVLVVRASEWQQRGVLHYHFLAGGGVARLRRLSYMDLWASKRCGMGWARIYPYDRTRGAVRYTTKYAVKGGEIDIFASPDILCRLRDRSVVQVLPLRLHS